MSDFDDPQVTRSSFSNANRRVLGAFRFTWATPFQKKSLWTYGVSTGGLITAVFLLFLWNPEPPVSDSASTISIPFNGQQEGIVPPTSGYSRATEITQGKTSAANSNGVTTGARRVDKFLGPQLIARNKGIKIPLGTMVRAVLISGASNGLVKASLKEGITFDGETMAKTGDILIGHGSSTDDRLFIQFSKLVGRDGKPGTVQGEAVDSSDKTPGLKGSKISAQALKLATGIGLNFLSGVSAGLQETRGEQGVLVQRPSVKNALLQGTAQASLDQSRDLMNDARNSKPVIAVESGTEILVLFSESGGTE